VQHDFLVQPISGVCRYTRRWGSGLFAVTSLAKLQAVCACSMVARQVSASRRSYIPCLAEPGTYSHAYYG
jgi:hypothetical protein